MKAEREARAVLKPHSLCEDKSLPSGSGPLPQAQLFSEASSTCISSSGWSHPLPLSYHHLSAILPAKNPSLAPSERALDFDLGEPNKA